MIRDFCRGAMIGLCVEVLHNIMPTPAELRRWSPETRERLNDLLGPKLRKLAARFPAPPRPWQGARCCGARVAAAPIEFPCDRCFGPCKERSVARDGRLFCSHFCAHAHARARDRGH